MSIPTYKAWINRASTQVIERLKFFCPGCSRVHTHGLAGDKVGSVVHRIAHCVNRGSHRKGYYLEIVATEAEAMKGVMEGHAAERAEGLSEPVDLKISF